MFDRYKDIPANFGAIPDGTYAATVFCCKNKIVETKSGDQFEKLLIGLELDSGGKVYKEYPDNYDWAWESWCRDLRAIDNTVDPKFAANEEDERGRILGAYVEITLKSKLDKSGNVRQNVFIKKPLLKEGEEGEDGVLDLDNEPDPFA